MAYRFPKDLKSIATSSKFREFCLNPFGIKIIQIIFYKKIFSDQTNKKFSD